MKGIKQQYSVLISMVVTFVLLAVSSGNQLRAATITVMNSPSSLPVVAEFTGHEEITGIYDIPGFGTAGDDQEET